MDYTNQASGSLLYERRATFEEFCRFKPHLTELITCVGGKQVRVKIRKSRHTYWLYRCTLCEETGIVRADNIENFRCSCRKRKQKKPRMPRTKKIQPKEKMCRVCKRILPLMIKYYYRSKAGYFASYCKKCYSGRYVSDKESGRLHYTPDECGRPIR